MSTIAEQTSFMKQTALLVYRNIALKKGMIYGGLVIIAGLLLITKLLTTFFPPINLIFGPVLFSTTAMIMTYGGYAFSSTMFNELNSAGSASQFLTLPASTLEKLTAAWLVSYVAYTAVGMAALYILSLIVGVNVSSMSTFTSLSGFYIYTILQSVFLFGAIYFKANNFLSTLVAMLVFAIGLSLISITLNSFIPNIAPLLFSVSSYFSVETPIGGIVNTVIISLVFLGFAYLRLKNRQIA